MPQAVLDRARGERRKERWRGRITVPRPSRAAVRQRRSVNEPVEKAKSLDEATYSQRSC